MFLLSKLRTGQARLGLTLQRKSLPTRLMELGEFATMDPKTLVSRAVEAAATGEFPEVSTADATLAFTAEAPWSLLCRRLAEVKDELEVNELANVIDCLRRANHIQGDGRLLRSFIAEFAMDAKRLKLGAIVQVLRAYKHFDVALPASLVQQMLTTGLQTAGPASLHEVGKFLVATKHLELTPTQLKRRAKLISRCLKGNAKSGDMSLADLMRVLSFASESDISMARKTAIDAKTDRTVAALSKAARVFPAEKQFVEELTVAVQNECVSKISAFFSGPVVSAPLEIPAMDSSTSRTQQKSTESDIFAIEETSEADNAEQKTELQYFARRAKHSLDRVEKISMQTVGERNRVMQKEVMEAVRSAGQLGEANLLKLLEPVVRDGVAGLTLHQLKETAEIFKTSQSTLDLINKEITRKSLKPIRVARIPLYY